MATTAERRGLVARSFGPRAPVPRSTIAILATVAAAVLMVPSLLDLVGSEPFHPHGFCYLWKPGLVWLHVVSDLLIGSSYVAISATLAYLVYRGRRHIPFSWVFLAFGMFIVACGATHYMEVWTLWHPTYWFAGSVKLITAAASVATAVVLPPLVPKVLEMIQSSTLAEQRRRELENTHGELTRLYDEVKQARDFLEQELRTQHKTLGEMAEELAHTLGREQAARRDAEEANRAKDEFLAVVSHELRTPLTAMLGWARMLRAGTLPPETVARALETIERNTKSQAQLIEDLLDISRITSGKLRLDVRRVELGLVVEAAIEALRPAADAKGIRIVPALDPHAGPTAGDAERLQQVFWNLLSNAIKFTPRGGRVEVTLARVHSHAEVRFLDTGQGIAPAFLPFVFDRFRQADPATTRAHGGLGLGLAIVRHLVEAHGGSVVAESAGEGCGASFTVKLALLAVASAASDRLPPAVDGALGYTPDPRLRGLKILVVDDEPETLEMVATILEQCGGEVRTALSAGAALAEIAVALPDVLISDIGMPGKDRYDFIRRVRELPPEAGGQIPALALTAYARVEDRLRVLSAGFQMHVPKPIEPAELIVIVASLAGWRQ